MLKGLRAFGAGIALLAVVSACDVAQVESPDPANILSGDPVVEGATGPVTILGSGQALDLGWRYLIYESADGWCTQLEMVEVVNTGCGPDLLPPEGEHLAAAGTLDPLEAGITPVHGVVSNEIATVWIIDEERGRLAATLMPLEEAGLEGQAFVGFLPPDVTPTHIQALAMSGEVLQTYELP